MNNRNKTMRANPVAQLLVRLTTKCSSAQSARTIFLTSSSSSSSQRTRSIQRKFVTKSTSSIDSETYRARQSSLKVAHILVDDSAPGLAMLEEIKLLIDSDSETFESLAKKHSKCASSARGGVLGFISKGQTVPEFEKVAWETNVNEIGFCRTKFGNHLVKVLEVREEGQDVPKMMSMKAAEVKELIESERDDVNFVDCRERHEWDVARVNGFKLYPLSNAEKWQNTIEMDMDPSRKTVVMCHGGIRSARVCQMLLSMGFEDVHNVVGGIDAYSSVDPSIPRY